MPADLCLPADVRSRALTPDDASAVTDLVAACERHDLGEVLVELEDVVGDWQRPTFDLSRHSVGVIDDAELVGYAEVFGARRAEVCVHPEYRGRGIGSALMRWTWATAAADGGRLVGQTVPETLTDAVRLFETSGYRLLWTSWILQFPPDSALPATQAPPGYSIRRFQPGRDERAAYQVIEEAFAEWPDREPTRYGDWAAVVLRRPGFDPSHLLLAVEDRTEEVVGACFLTPTEDTGWVQELAVRRDRRGHGLGRALLARAFAEARARGATRTELATDSRTGALALYEHVGMRVRLTFRHFARELSAPGTVTTG